VETAEAAKKTAEDKAADMEKQKADLETKNQELTVDVQKLTKKLKDLLQAQGTSNENTAAVPTQPVWNYPPGAKGKVVAVNDKWNYVLIKLDDAFIKEITGDDPAVSKPAPTGITMSIKRTSPKEAFVAKAKLTQIRLKDKYAIGDVLPDWKQQPVKEGDLVFFP